MWLVYLPAKIYESGIYGPGDAGRQRPVFEYSNTNASEPFCIDSNTYKTMV